MSARKNIVNILIILLLAANMVTLGMIWLNRPKHPERPKDVIEFLSTEINFDEKQRSELKKLFEDHRLATQSNRESIRQQKDAFFDLLTKENISDSALEQESYKSVDAQRKMDIAVFKHFKQILALCNTDEQRKKFEKVVQEALRIMKRPPGPPQGPPPEGERPEGPPPH